MVLQEVVTSQELLAFVLLGTDVTLVYRSGLDEEAGIERTIRMHWRISAGMGVA